jgi:predicted TIM-barrel fold metal-dependent hydrolase
MNGSGSPLTAVQPRESAVDPVATLTIDCDVHPHFPKGTESLRPYLSQAWQRRLLGEGDPHDVYANRLAIPKNDIYINTGGPLRRDTTAPDGSVPGSDPAFTAMQLLDASAIDRAVLLTGNMLGLGAMPDPDAAAEFARAHNDWLADHWLDFDPRYRGAAVVAPQDPELAAAEIDRIAGRPGFVSILLPLMNIRMGNRHHYPIYAAAERAGLPVAVHPNSVDGVFQNGPMLPAGPPTYYVEWHSSLTHVFQANVVSLLCHGVFERFPGLKVIITEGGFAWLPDTIWNLDRNWQALRDEVPWVKRLPSEYLYDHIRFTTQPFIEPPRHAYIAAMLEMVQADRILMFSSDYPHWNFDDPQQLLRSVPAEMRDRIQGQNAADLFGDRLD